MKFGLALSGGGARGLAHIGALKVLEEARIPIHMLAGTSMGGLISAAYAAGRSADEIAEFARSLRLLDILQRDPEGLGLMGVGKIAARLRDALGGDLTFDQLKLPLALVAVDLETGAEVVMREGSVIEAMLATMALPPFFPPRRRDGRLLVDGGVLNPNPFDVVRRMGADRVIAVQVEHILPDSLEAEPPVRGLGAEAFIRIILARAHWIPLLHISERSLSIISRKLIEPRLREAPPDLLIEVPLRGVGLLDLDMADECIRAGEETVRSRLDDLLALRDAPPPPPPSLWQVALRRLGIARARPAGHSHG